MKNIAVINIPSKLTKAEIMEVTAVYNEMYKESGYLFVVLCEGMSIQFPKPNKQIKNEQEFDYGKLWNTEPVIKPLHSPTRIYEGYWEYNNPIDGGASECLTSRSEGESTTG